MWLFGKKNEDLTLKERIKTLEHRITLIEAEILDIATAQNIIRNKVLKKIQFKNPKEDEEKPEQEKDLYSKVLLAEK